MLAFAWPAAAHAADYHTPGYKGLTKAPKVKTPPQPPPIDIGAGTDPDVLVDAAGTAHITWTSDPPTGSDTLEYCRLPRGATTCAVRQSLVPGAPIDALGGEALDVEMGGPTVLALGDEVALLTHRYPNIRQHPGRTSDRTTWLYTSENGGTSFGEPGIIGDAEASGGALVYGSDPPSIGVISDTRTGGTFFQGSPAGQYVAAQALLGPGDGAYDGRLALLPDGRPLAAFADLTNHVLVREWTGTGSVNDAANWTAPQVLAGEQPRVAGGPTGTYLMSRADSGAKYDVRQLAPTPGAPTIVSDHRGSAPALAMDPSGGLHAMWVDPMDEGAVEVRNAISGTGFGPAVTLTKDLNAGDTAIAAAADGGGLAVWGTKDDAGASVIRAGIFGSTAATGKLGLGSLAGGGDDGGSSSCSAINFGAVTATTNGIGCFLADTKSSSGAKVSTGTVRLNGLDIVPDAGARIVVDRRQKTLDTFGSVTVLIGDVQLWRGELHIKLPSDKAGTVLASFDTSKFPVLLKGFPVRGNIDIELLKDSVRIPISIELPPAFGGIRGNAVLTADNARGLHLDSLHIAADTVPLGPLVLKDLAVDYQGAGEVWEGKLTLLLPPQPTGGKIAGLVRFEMGSLKRAYAAFTPPAPGITLGPGVFLTTMDIDLSLDPTRLQGSATVVAGPVVQDKSLVDVKGSFDFQFPDVGPSTLSMSGVLHLADVQVADNNFTFRTDGTANLSGNVGIDLEVASVTGAVRGSLDGPAGVFDAAITGEVCVAFPVAGKLCLDQTGLISSRGFAVCAGFNVLGETVSAGYGYHWGGNPYDPDNLLIPCDVGPFTSGGGGRLKAKAAQAGSSVTIPRGAQRATVRIVGQGGAPAVTLTGPDGASIVTSDTPEQLERVGGALVLRDAKRTATYIVLDQPAAGSWQVQAHPASVPISSVAVGVAAPVKVSGTVAKAKNGRVLRYQASGLGGRQVRFVSQSADATDALGLAKEGSGTLRIPDDGAPAGQRTVVALVERDGLIVEQHEVARFTAAAPRAPKRPSSVRVTRSGKGLVVRWGASAGAKSYQLRVDTAQGKRLMLTAGAKARKLTVPGIARYDTASVALTAIGVGDLRSPAARAKSKATIKLRA